MIRTRLPDKKLQTQQESEESQKAKERMVDRGHAEKNRRDKAAREEELSVGMKVLLKQKTKKKGMPRYDPKPFTITELVGRQAVLQRGSSTLKRETQKFKRFYECEQRNQVEKQKVHVEGQDDWEDHRTLKEPERAAPELSTTEVPVMSSDSNPIPNTGNATQSDNNLISDEPRHLPRRSSRERKVPEKYGTWVTK